MDPEARYGCGFEGPFVRPGQQLDSEDAWPDGRPHDLVVLECAGSGKATADGRPVWGHNCGEALYLLWRYYASTGEWEEIIRAKSQSWEWAIDLRPVALRLLSEIRGPSIEVIPSLYLIAGRIGAFLDGELKVLDPENRARLLCAMHDQIGFRLSKTPLVCEHAVLLSDGQINLQR